MAHTLPQHIASLDGIRALAALGVLFTHVSFQTATGWAWAERLDYCVAVFFCLSAFVLWRGGPRPLRSYARSRARRILPAYYACVFAVILLLPDAATMSAGTIAANLSFSAIYVPHALAPGLTHLWSLCVEMAFYLVLPLLWWTLGRITSRVHRIAVVLGVAAASIGWPYLPQLVGWQFEEVNIQLWPPAFVLWFALGIIAAELEASAAVRWAAIHPQRRQYCVRWVRGAGWALAAAMLWLASREFYGPLGLVHPTAAEFSRRILAGGVFAAAVVWPYALTATAQVPTFLASRWATSLGRWSYSLFLWHMAILSLVFPILGVPLFSGQLHHFVLVLAATLALSIIVAAASYRFIEQPVLAATAIRHSTATRAESPA